MRTQLFQTIFVLAILLISSCDNTTQTQKLKHENQEKQDKIEEQTKQINRLEERLNRIETNQGPKSSDNYKENNNNSSYANQYYFIVLEVVEKHYPNSEQFFYTTLVNQLNNYNDNIKYRLLDEVVSQYKSSPNGIAYEGNVKKRHIFLFSSYEEASRAREKYIMN